MSEQSPPADPLAQRLLRLAGLLSVLLIAVVVNGLLNGGDGSDELSLNPIAAAAERTQEAPGGQIAVRAAYTAPGLDTEVVATGTGAFDAVSGRSSVTLTVPAPGAGEVTIEAVGDARRVYMRSAVFESELPPGKEWISYDPWLGNNEAASMASSADVRGGLEMLEASGDDYSSLGEETLNGVATSRYRATIELGAYAEELRAEGKDEAAELYERMAEEMPGPATSEVWVDATDLIQRMRMVMELPAPDGDEAMTMDMTMDFTHLDAAPPIELPPAAEVYDMTPRIEAELGVSAGEGPAGVAPGAAPPELDREEAEPAGGRLSPLGFRRSTNRICGQMRTKAEAIVADAEAAADSFERRAPALKGQGRDAAREELHEFFAEYTDRYMEPIYAMGEDTLELMGQLSPPAAAQARFDRMLRLGAIEMELIRSQIDAMRMIDQSTYDAIDARLDRLSERSDEIARELGLHACMSDEDEGPSSGSSA